MNFFKLNLSIIPTVKPHYRMLVTYCIKINFKSFQPQKRIGVAIGEEILDLSAIAHLFDGPLLKNKQDVFRHDYLNDFMALGRSAWIEARNKLQDLLSISNPTLQEPNIRSK